MQALVLDDGSSTAPLVTALRDAGVLVTAAGGKALRFTPALNITEEEMDSGLKIVEAVLENQP